jgi:NAD(P)-dependent dehydrogenase (short-subunit alcohol dehydrogenase family)
MARRVIAITGAAAGVGRAVALAFARKKERIGLIARSKAGLLDAKAEVEREGGQAAAFPADVADPVAVRNAAEHIEQALGPIDIWINCAMVTVYSRVDDMTPEEYRRVTEVTYLGYVHGRVHMPHHPQPVPPIYRPEVAAEAIVFAAEHPERRE